MLKLNRYKHWYKYLQDDLKQGLNSNPNVTYLVSFPKSGVTWLQLMLSQFLVRHYQINQNKIIMRLNELTKSYPFLPQIRRTHEESYLINENGTYNNPHKLFIYGGRIRYLKNKVILLVRDPRDVVVSHYYQVTKRSEKPLHFDSLSQFVQDPIYGFDRIIRFYMIWHRNWWIPKKIMLIRYEDLLENTETEIQNILNFVNICNVDQRVINEVVQFCRADNMRKLEKEGNIEGMKKFGEKQDSMKVRKAKTGSYQEELSDPDIDFCNKRMKVLPKIYGY